ncbi:CPBP family glutamic-type intramembrane protease [Brachybacterium hainanense]|uniref:Type II CAAX prenyl endopeptidase Rce1 family protein n=1 Tax=Brachybacterium hainanense TaxID=1541174 RepID=A0ABV6RDF3_9MICO
MTAPAEGTAYPRLAHLRAPWSRWWRPLLAIGVAILAYVVLAQILVVAVVLVLPLLPGTDPELGMALGDPASPLDVTMALLMGALWWPSALLGVRVGGWRPARWLWSVTGAFRTGLLRAAALPVLGASLLGTVLVTLLVALLDPSPGASPSATGPALAAAVLATVLGTAKAIGAELALRGLALQAVGTWLRSPWLTVPVATLLALPAAEPTAPGLLIAAAMGLACGYLAWRSGGLELPILLSASLTVSGGLVAAVMRILEGWVNPILFPGPDLAIGLQKAQLGSTASGAAGIPGIASATVLGAAGIGVLALLIAAALGWWIGRREGLRPGEPVRRAADAPAPELLAV